MFEGASYAGDGGNPDSPSPSGRTVSDDHPLVRLRKATGGAAQSSRAIPVVDSSPKRTEIVPAPAAVNPPAPQRAPSMYTGVVNRGLPSVQVQ